jgi:hypothetical protein
MTQTYFRIDIADLEYDEEGQHHQELRSDWEEWTRIEVENEWSWDLDLALEEAKRVANERTNEQEAVRIVLVTEREWTTAYPEE